VKGQSHQIAGTPSGRSTNLDVVAVPTAQRSRQPGTPHAHGPVTATTERVDLPDDALLRAVYAEHGRALYEFVLNRTSGDRQWAEDIVQETMIRLWRSIDRTNFVPNLRPLLYTIARRLIIDGLRSRRARPPEVSDSQLDELPCTDDELERSLLALTVKHALELLPPAQRAVIVGLYFQGRTIEDVASHLSIPSGTVKSRAYYGLCALRATFERLGIDRPA
jgi:RNA polymerase sigma-70 factor (ECF subfamily)